jgi:hypothetical protein
VTIIASLVSTPMNQYNYISFKASPQSSKKKVLTNHVGKNMDILFDERRITKL